jgi:hypothetical protein
MSCIKLTKECSVYYTPTVLVSSVGVEPGTALLIAGFIQIMFPIGNTVPALFLDRMGRRWTMIWGCAALSICMMMIAILLSIGRSATSSAAIAFFFLVSFVHKYVDISNANALKYMLIFGGTINVVPWVYVRIVDNVFRGIKSADAHFRAPKSYHWRQELEALRSRSLLIGCGVSISIKTTHKARSDLIFRLLRCHDYSSPH